MAQTVQGKGARLSTALSSLVFCLRRKYFVKLCTNSPYVTLSLGTGFEYETCSDTFSMELPFLRSTKIKIATLSPVMFTAVTIHLVLQEASKSSIVKDIFTLILDSHKTRIFQTVSVTRINRTINK